jgi:signal transduction histidine kinase
LILHSNQRPTPAQIIVEDTLRTVVPNTLKRPVQLFSEYLDDEWTSLQTYSAVQAAFLRVKYGGRNIRVIVTNALPALQFARDFRDEILPGVPVVHIAVARDRLEGAQLPADILGNFEDNDPTPTLQLALHLHPNTRRIVIIRGASERDRFWDGRLRAASQQVESDVAVDYLAGLPTADVLRRVSALSQGTIVFTPGYFVDGEGQVSTPRESVERIVAASAVPVYGTFDTQLGAGIVGGYMSPYEGQAKQAAGIVTRLLNGALPSEISPGVATRVPMVDWRQVRRWGINERLLPPETIVRFREPTVWDRYWREISVGVAVVLLQAALISALLLERRSGRRTAAALEESEKQMNLAASAARLSLWIWDTARKKVTATARSRHRNDAANDKPTSFAEVINSAHPADREILQRAVTKALATGEELDVEYRVVDADGGVRWVAARGRAEKSDSQRLLGVALDVTERKAAELRAAQDRTALRHMTRVSMIGQLSAAIAHQLNQPLAAILGNAEAAQKMLGRQQVDLAELREICNDIVSEDHRASEVIRRLSDLYRRGDMKIEPVDVNALINETLDLLRTELLIRHVNPLMELAPNLPMIEGGRVQLQQVVLNLVLNAADAMSAVKDDQRKLTIRTELHDPDVRLCVVDNGSGIAADDIKNVFDPFWSTKPGGMGMGLAICHSIVGAHRGTLTVANNAQGGATFCVSLPVTEPASN